VIDHAYGRPEYASPEYLAAKNRKGSFVRSASDDNYGLAVLIFRLLNDWQRPYLYRGAKRLSAEALIQEGRFPYGSPSDKVIPDAVATLATYDAEMDPRLKRLFEGAFLKGQPRPTAADWATALGESALARKDFASMQKKAPAAPRAAPLQPPQGPPTHVPVQIGAPSSSIEWLIVGGLVLAAFVIWLLSH
jgi:DNA-binding helix-hairpin-helix protein with protein kinase domain